MVFLAAILLQFIGPTSSNASEMTALLQQKDWPGLVLLLRSKEGQNFDHDLILSKAYIQLERRADAQKLLRTWLEESKYAELAKKQLDLVSNIFFNQETSNLYFDAVRLISIRKWAEAKERLDQAIVKEPGNILLMSRLVQVEIQLGLKDAASEHLKAALTLNPIQKELNVFSARLALDDEEDKEAQRTLLGQKSWIFEHELPTIWYFDSLQSLKRSSEILTMQKVILKSHPNWAELRVWLLKNGLVPKDQIALVKSQMEELFKDQEKFNQTQESEYRKGQYYWISNNTIDQLKATYVTATTEKPVDKTAEKPASTNP